MAPGELQVGDVPISHLEGTLSIDSQLYTVFTASECLVQTCVYIYHRHKLIKNDTGSSHFQSKYVSENEAPDFIATKWKMPSLNVCAPGRRGNCDGEAKQIVGKQIVGASIMISNIF